MTLSFATTAALTILPVVSFPVQDGGAAAVPPGWHSERVGPITRLTPPDVPAGKAFTLILQPEESLGGDSLRSWLEARMQKDTPSLGTLIKDGDITPAGGGRFYTCVRGFRLAKGNAEIVVMYIAAQRPDGRVQLSRILSSPQQEIYQRYVKDALKVALTGSIGGAATTTASSGGTSTKTAASSSTRPISSAEERRRQYTTAPGAGVKPSQIAGIYAHTTTQIGVGGYVYVVYEPLLALKDGTYYEDLDVPPSDFNVTASRQIRPKAWGKWRRANGKIETLGKKGWSSERWIGPYAPVSAGTPLSGSFSHIGGGGNTAYGGGTMIAAVNSFNFHPNGSFEGGGSASVSSHEPGSGGSVVTGSNRSNAGTYKLEGYALTLRYNDGRVDRRSFVWMDEKKHDAFYLNGSAYLQEDKH